MKIIDVDLLWYNQCIIVYYAIYVIVDQELLVYPSNPDLTQDLEVKKKYALYNFWIYLFPECPQNSELII